MDELENMSREDLLRGIAFLRGEVCQREESRQALFAELASLRGRVRHLENALHTLARWQITHRTLDGEMCDFAEASLGDHATPNLGPG